MVAGPPITTWRNEVSDRHVLHVIDTLSPGGAERMAVEIANRTPGKVTVCGTRALGELASSLEPDVNVFSLQRKRRWDLHAVRELATFCRERSVDVIHVHGRSSYLLVALLRVTRRLPGRVGVIAHDHYGDVEIEPRLGLAYRLALALVQPVYVGVHPTLTALAGTGIFRCKDAVTIENAITFDSAPPERSDTEVPTGVMVANVRPSKDVATAIDALDRVAQRSWKVLVVGDSAGEYAETCQNRVKGLGLAGRIEFLGIRDDVRQLLRTADFGIHSARSESGPLVLLEFANASLPFVSTQVGTVGHRLWKEGVPGFVPPGDVEGFARGLDQLLTMSHEDLMERGRLGRSVAQRSYDLSRVITRWTAVYDRAQGSV